MFDTPAFDDVFQEEDARRVTAEPHTGWSIPGLVVGGSIVAIAVSGLLDDTGAFEHPYWVVPAAGLFAICAAVAGRTVKRLLSADDGAPNSDDR